MAYFKLMSPRPFSPGIDTSSTFTKGIWRNNAAIAVSLRMRRSCMFRKLRKPILTRVQILGLGGHHHISCVGWRNRIRRGRQSRQRRINCSRTLHRKWAFYWARGALFRHDLPPALFVSWFSTWSRAQEPQFEMKPRGFGQDIGVTGLRHFQPWTRTWCSPRGATKYSWRFCAFHSTLWYVLCLKMWPCRFWFNSQILSSSSTTPNLTGFGGNSSTQILSRDWQNIWGKRLRTRQRARH